MTVKVEVTGVATDGSVPESVVVEWSEDDHPTAADVVQVVETAAKAVARPTGGEPWRP